MQKGYHRKSPWKTESTVEETVHFFFRGIEVFSSKKSHLSRFLFFHKICGGTINTQSIVKDRKIENMADNKYIKLDIRTGAHVEK